MAIVINTISNEPSTDDVLDWLFYLKEYVIRLNDELNCDRSTVYINNDFLDFKLMSEDIDLKLSDIRSYWYRRGRINLMPKYKLDNDLLQSSYNYYKREVDYLTDAIYNIGSYNYKSLNTYHDNNTNKLINLIEAQKLEIKIPPTIITNNIIDIEQFATKYNNIIMKPIVYPEFKAYNHASDTAVQIAVGTVKMTQNEIIDFLKNKTISSIVPTLFQAYIDKKYEIRSFFLNDTFYSMAIFSQANDRTKTDFRNYDNDKPNRTIPYKLPESIEAKLRKLMSTINMNCGSFDIIVTPDLQYIFLEVNPIGQFAWLSKNCNYFIEKHIAKTLCL